MRRVDMRQRGVLLRQRDCRDRVGRGGFRPAWQRRDRRVPATCGGGRPTSSTPPSVTRRRGRKFAPAYLGSVEIRVSDPSIAPSFTRTAEHSIPRRSTLGCSHPSCNSQCSASSPSSSRSAPLVSTSSGCPPADRIDLGSTRRHGDEFTEMGAEFAWTRRCRHLRSRRRCERADAKAAEQRDVLVGAGGHRPDRLRLRAFSRKRGPSRAARVIRSRLADHGCRRRPGLHTRADPASLRAPRTGLREATT